MSDHPEHRHVIPDDPGFRKLLTRDLALTLTVLVALFVAVLLGSLFFNDEILGFTHFMAEHFGLTGLTILVFVSDMLVSPLPPDLVLLVIAKSALRETWWWSVPLIGMVSMLAGHGGWVIGRLLRGTKTGQLFAGKHLGPQQEFVRRYGHWGVILGAATPVPYSVTCWAAGFLGMAWPQFALAAIFRVPRFVLYYVVIHLSDLVI